MYAKFQGISEIVQKDATTFNKTSKWYEIYFEFVESMVLYLSLTIWITCRVLMK